MRSGETGDTILIFAPVPLHRGADGALMLEDQACNGLRLWAENFARVIVMMPLAPGPPPPAWVPLSRVEPTLDRIEVIPLPWAWRIDRFLRALPATRAVIRAAIGRADYLSFAIGGLFGDWGSVACGEAFRMNRPYAVWTDRVESAVTRQVARTAPHWRARLRARLTHRPMAALEHRLIRRATLGLFHGRETYDAYAPYAQTAELVHDIHLTRTDHISPEALAAKRAAAGTGPLRILYVGRAEAMKGPMDWATAVEGLAEKRVDFTATWLGDGALMPALRSRIEGHGLSDRVHLPGFAADRGAVFAALRAAHVFVFCHLTPESPRVLIEALVSGTPLAGYDGAFARDLISDAGGGALSRMGDTTTLVQTLVDLARDRPRLADLMARAAKDGAPFEDRVVFAHRAALIRRHLPPAPR